MSDLLVTLVPLAVGSAIVPIQIIITILLLRSSDGRTVALAWVAGMTTLRLLQGVVFGLILRPGEPGSGEDGDAGLIVSIVLLVLAMLMYVVAARQFAKEPDEDAPPPKWMAMIGGITPGRAFLLGMGLLSIGAKFWVFTLAAIAAIGEASLGQPGSTVAFLVFVALAESIHLAILAGAFAAPARAEAALERLSVQLERYNGPIVIALGIVFGTWFLLKGLSGLGVL